MTGIEFVAVAGAIYGIWALSYLAKRFRNFIECKKYYDKTARPMRVLKDGTELWSDDNRWWV